MGPHHPYFSDPDLTSPDHYLHPRIDPFYPVTGPNQPFFGPPPFGGNHTTFILSLDSFVVRTRHGTPGKGARARRKGVAASWRPGPGPLPPAVDVRQPRLLQLDDRRLT